MKSRKLKKLAKVLNFKKFRIKKTSRFKSDKFEVLDKFGKFSHFIEPPTDLQFRHPNLKLTQQLNSNDHDLTAFKINCEFKNNAMLYVNSRLEVFACCFIADDFESKDSVRFKSEPQYKSYPVFSLRKSTWTEILTSEYFANGLTESFAHRPLTRCVKTCGKADIIKQQNSSILL